MVRRASMLLLIACGPNASNVTYLREAGDHCPVSGCSADAGGADAAPIPIPNEPLEKWDTTNAGPLTGIFAVETTISARVVVPLVLHQLFRLRIVQRGAHVHEKTTLCAFQFPDVKDVAKLAIPNKLQDLLTSKATEADGDFLGNANVVGATYTPPPFLMIAGAKLANEATDPLPTSTDLTNAIDEDADGHPGVTLLANVLGCTAEEQLYVALRTGGVLAGTVQTPDVITGKVNVELDESIVGWSNDCLATAAKIQIHIEPSSPFRAVRVGDDRDLDHNGNVSCPELVFAAPQLFPDWNP